jgi:hypothetical protein
MPGDSGCNRGGLTRVVLFFPCEAAGANRRPAFPTPSVFRGGCFRHGPGEIRVAGGVDAWLFEILDRKQANLPARLHGESSSPRRNVMFASSPVEQLPQHVLHRLALLLHLRRGVALLGMRLRGWILAW